MSAQLKGLVVALAEANKTHTLAISTLISEIAALRNLLIQMNGEQFEKDFLNSQIAVMAAAAKTESLGLQLCDVLIEQAKAL